MTGSNLLDPEELRVRKVNFWSVWTLANALGAALGWFLGYGLSNMLPTSMDPKLTNLAGELLFEVTVWCSRWIVIKRFEEFNPLKGLEALFWIINEVFALSIFLVMGQKETSELFLEVTLAQVWGAGLWIVFALIMRSPRQDGKRPSGCILFFSSFLKGLFGFIGGTILLALIAVGSNQVGETIQKISFLLGWLLAGLALGGSIGAVTGLAFVRLMNWNGVNPPWDFRPARRFPMKS